jgi:hypothetical protein
VSIDFAERLHAVVDAGVWGRTDAGGLYLAYGAGLTFAATADLFVGVEAYGALSFEDADEAWVAAGPCLSFTHGRFWITASLPIGLRDGPDLSSRIVWATAF